MKLGDLLGECSYKLIKGTLDADITGIVYDSRQVSQGNIYIAIKGTRVDSHDYISQAVLSGAIAVVIEKDVEVIQDVTVIRVDNSREVLARMSAAFFDYPARKMTTIGVTGTKGKTTTAHMIKAILEASGKKVGMIGTNGAFIGDKVYQTMNTTPESYKLHEYFSQMVLEGCEYMVMEVSSQSIKMHRTYGLEFDYGLFTNISPDHIGPDEHENFEEYLYYKSQLLNVCRIGIVNKDDEHYNEIISHVTNSRIYTYSLNKDADFIISNIRYISEHDFIGLEFNISGRYEADLKVSIPGKFNVYNAAGAVSVCSFLGLSAVKTAHALEHISVNGRMEIAYSSPKCTIIIDYAHNAVSMESLLNTLRDYKPKRLVCVFGCGGNRSKDRRYSMGEISGRLADFSIITADNSRYEKVEDIISDIRGSIEKTGGKFIEIPDRYEAIEYSIKNSLPGDMIAIIGKGHEDYQEINGVRHHFLDREVVEKVIKSIEE